MQKPNGYDEVAVNVEKERIKLGGHYAVIKQVVERASSTGKPMIVVLFDFDNNDSQPGYFMNAFKEDVREDKKWPFQGSKYIMVNDYADNSKTSKQFKSFCSCVEKSNNYSIKWGIGDWGKQFVGKTIGVVYGQEEQEYNGATFMREVVKWFCNTSAVESSKVPEPKYLAKKPSVSTDDYGFVNVPDDIQSDSIPF